jgi:hypothetical protein
MTTFLDLTSRITGLSGLLVGDGSQHKANWCSDTCSPAVHTHLNAVAPLNFLLATTKHWFLEHRKVLITGMNTQSIVLFFGWDKFAKAAALSLHALQQKVPSGRRCVASQL